MNKLNNRPRKPGRPARFLFIKTARGRDFYLDRKHGAFYSVPEFGICTERSKREGYVMAAHDPKAFDHYVHVASLARAAHRLGFLKATTYYAVA